ncbi:MAG: hypothetical protein RBG13Loki_3186 [Promethearchaeota archaeon CR_4]|nr:MAG: hypothetical protein RBG13Loki_3186 [Candidatus Lokiarchaeota archaeon CR_4]
MLQFNFLLFATESTNMQEMIGEFLHVRPKTLVEPIISHQVSYKDLLPLSINFIFCHSHSTIKSTVEQVGVIHNALFVFDVSNADSFDALAPQIISSVMKESGTNRSILVGLNPSGSGATRVPKDKILLYSQTNDIFYYFEVVPKTKYDFRALFKRLIMENLAEFKQQFPEKYQEELKQARRAKLEAEKKAEEQEAEAKQKQ